MPDTEPIKQELPPIERCLDLDARIRTPYDRDRLKELGFISFHQAVGTLLLEGGKRRAAVDVLQVKDGLVQNAAVRLGLKWSHAKERKKHVVVKHQPRKSKTQFLTDSKNQRECSKCGELFVQTVQRRLLCQSCFAGAENEESNSLMLKGVY